MRLHSGPAGDDPGGEPLPEQRRADFAARLRALRADAGSPSFRQLAKLTNYSSSTLADATAGKRLPTEPVVRALVAACGADPEPWVAELHRIAAAAAQPTPLPVTPEPAAPARRAGTPGGWRRLLLLAAGGGTLFAGGLALGSTVLAAPAAPAPRKTPAPAVAAGAFSGTPSPAPTARVADGADPDVAHCAADGVLVNKAPVLLGGVQIGALELHYSAWCGAGWALLYLYSGQPTMMGEVTVRAGDGRSSSIADPLVKQIDDYTNVVVPGPGGCLGAEAVVYEAGHAAVTASVPCQAPAG